MRPRKRIAVLGATELEESVLCVVLEAHGYAVEICVSENAAMRIETPQVFVILGLDQAQRQRVESRLRLQHPDSGFAMESHGVTVCMTSFLERVALAASRRRGPRLKPKHTHAKASAAGEVVRAEKNRRRIA